MPLALWRIARLSLAYLLDTMDISRGGGDLLDPLILSAVLDANLAFMNNDAGLQLEYAAAPPPDELRRPVSINAVAQSLGLPFETVRRRVRRLAAEGMCQVSDAGVIVPRVALAAPAYERATIARYARLKRFHWDLAEAGVLSHLIAGQAPAIEAVLPPGAPPPVRLANRLLSEYLMRFIDSVMQRIGDPLTGLVLLEVVRANTEHLTRAEQEAVIPIPDALRRPITVGRLANRMRVPAETVRRRLKALVEMGFCERAPGGYVVMASGVERPGVRGLIAENGANVQRLFVRLHRLGVLDYWRAELAGGGAAAGRAGA